MSRLARSRWVDVRLHRLLRNALRRWGAIQSHDFADLLRLAHEFSVHEMIVEAGHWLIGRRLADARLLDEGVTVLGIHRADGSYRGVPRGETAIRVGDRLILYGATDDLEALAARRRDALGDAAHEEAIQDVRRERARQAWEDRKQASLADDEASAS